MQLYIRHILNEIEVIYRVIKNNNKFFVYMRPGLCCSKLCNNMIWLFMKELWHVLYIAMI